MDETQPAREQPNNGTGNPFTPWIPPFSYVNQRIVDSKHHLILDMRGWGFLTGMGGIDTGASLGLDQETATQLQDEAGHNAAVAMNLFMQGSGVPTSQAPVDSPQPKSETPAATEEARLSKTHEEWCHAFHPWNTECNCPAGEKFWKEQDLLDAGERSPSATSRKQEEEEEEVVAAIERLKLGVKYNANLKGLATDIWTVCRAAETNLSQSAADTKRLD